MFGCLFSGYLVISGVTYTISKVHHFKYSAESKLWLSALKI